MTLIIGIAAQDGIVMAADSEESTGYAGFFTGSVQKIMTFTSGIQIGQNASPLPVGGVCAIGGAGEAGYVEVLRDTLGRTFLDNSTLKHDQLRDAFGRDLQKSYRDHVIPFAKFPSDERPNPSMIITAQRSFSPHLYVTNRNTVRSGFAYAAIGCGEIFAKAMLGSHFRGGTVKQVEALAVYILLMAKAQVEGIGKSTDVVTLNGWTIKNTASGSVLAPPECAASLMPRAKVSELEARFASEFIKTERDRLWEFIEALP